MPRSWRTGAARPDQINTQYETTYKQVVFHIHGLENKYENTYFITWTPGHQDVILHAAEGQISRAAPDRPDTPR